MKNNNLFVLVLILFALYYLFSGNEKMENMSDFTPLYDKETSDKETSDTSKTSSKDKLCGQKAINDAYNTWTFGSPKFVR